MAWSFAGRAAHNPAARSIPTKRVTRPARRLKLLARGVCCFALSLSMKPLCAAQTPSVEWSLRFRFLNLVAGLFSDGYIWKLQKLPIRPIAGAWPTPCRQKIKPHGFDTAKSVHFCGQPALPWVGGRILLRLNYFSQVTLVAGPIGRRRLRRRLDTPVNPVNPVAPDFSIFILTKTKMEGLREVQVKEQAASLEKFQGAGV